MEERKNRGSKMAYVYGAYFLFGFYFCINAMAAVTNKDIINNLSNMDGVIMFLIYMLFWPLFYIFNVPVEVVLTVLGL